MQSRLNSHAHVPEKWASVFRKGHAPTHAHVPEKWAPVFRKGHAPTQETRAQPDSTRSGFALGLKSLSLGSVNLALVSVYFFPLWGREAFRALISRYGLDDRASAAAAFYIGQLFDLGPRGVILTGHVLAGIKLVVAVAFACYLIEFARSLAVRRAADRDTIDVVLILAAVGVALSGVSALALGDAALIRLAATQTLMIAGAILVIVVERQLAARVPEFKESRVTTAAREREILLGLPAGALAPPPAAVAPSRISEARLRHALTQS
jgi:hypothetical protein